jgi:hypothetical protein
MVSNGALWIDSLPAPANYRKIDAWEASFAYCLFGHCGAHVGPSCLNNVPGPFFVIWSSPSQVPTRAQVLIYHSLFNSKWLITYICMEPGVNSGCTQIICRECVDRMCNNPFLVIWSSPSHVSIRPGPMYWFIIHCSIASDHVYLY